MLNRLISKNQNSVKTTGRLILGRTAMDLVMDNAVKRLPFFARLFQGNRVKHNELARLGVAEAALAAQLHFAPDNEKLATVAEAMVEHAMADVVLDSAVVKSITDQLEKLVK